MTRPAREPARDEIDSSLREALAARERADLADAPAFDSVWRGARRRAESAAQARARALLPAGALAAGLAVLAIAIGWNVHETREREALEADTHLAMVLADTVARGTPLDPLFDDLPTSVAHGLPDLAGPLPLAGPYSAEELP